MVTQVFMDDGIERRINATSDHTNSGFFNKRDISFSKGFTRANCFDAVPRITIPSHPKMADWDNPSGKESSNLSILIFPVVCWGNAIMLIGDSRGCYFVEGLS